MDGGRVKLFRAPAAIFWAGFALRVAVILLGHTYRIRPLDDHFDFGFEAGRIARSLVEGRGYANPFNGYSGPTAWLPPLYPLLLAMCFKLFGVYSSGAAIAITVLDSAFSALIAPAIYEVAARCFDAYGLARRASRQAAPVALWSAWLWALYPAAMQYAVHWVWEMSLSACLFAWAVVVALRLGGVGELQGERSALAATTFYDAPNGSGRLRNMGRWVALGLLWGAIALSNASLLLMFPASLGWLWWPVLRRGLLRRELGEMVTGTAMACVLSGLVLLPWVVRNELVLHAFVPTRANLGIELWRSTLFAENGPLPWGTAMPLSSHVPEFQRYVQEGEVHYAKEKGEVAKRNLRARPDLFAKYTLERIQFFWFGSPHPDDGHPVREYLRILQYAATSLAGLLGLGLMLRRRVAGAGLIGLALFCVPLVYYAVTVQARFRHPLEPFITVCAVYLFRSTGTRRVAMNEGIPVVAGEPRE